VLCGDAGTCIQDNAADSAVAKAFAAIADTIVSRCS
jgi:hypothetical protein